MTAIRGWSKRRKIGVGIVVAWIGGTIAIAVAFGSGKKNPNFLPQDEFQIVSWAHLFGPIDFNKAVLYLVLAGAITVAVMVFVARRIKRQSSLATASASSRSPATTWTRTWRANGSR